MLRRPPPKHERVHRPVWSVSWRRAGRTRGNQSETERRRKAQCADGGSATTPVELRATSPKETTKDGAFMEPSRSQPAATSGKWNGAEHGSDGPKPLPWVATGCRRDSMVRRGSTVRVRQRAYGSKKYLQSRYFCCLGQHHRAPPHDHRDCSSSSRATRKVPGKSPYRRPSRSTSSSGREARSCADRLQPANSLIQAVCGIHIARQGDASGRWGQVLGTGGAIQPLRPVPVRDCARLPRGGVLPCHGGRSRWTGPDRAWVAASRPSSQRRSTFIRRRAGGGRRRRGTR
jgi:hypothetical protein